MRNHVINNSTVLAAQIKACRQDNRKRDQQKAAIAKAALPVEVAQQRKRLLREIEVAQKKGNTLRVRALVSGTIIVK